MQLGRSARKPANHGPKGKPIAAYRPRASELTWVLLRRITPQVAPDSQPINYGTSLVLQGRRGEPRADPSVPALSLVDCSSQPIKGRPVAEQAT